MVSWETFKRVRKLNVQKWLINRGVTSYDSLVEKLKIINVTPPLIEEYERIKPVVAVIAAVPVAIIEITEDTENKALEVKQKDIQTPEQAIINVSGEENIRLKKRLKKLSNETE